MDATYQPIIEEGNEGNKNNYEEVRSIPHLWSNDKSVRYFSSNEKEYKEVS